MTDTPTTTTPVTPETPAPLPVAPALPYSFKANLREYRKRLGIARFILALAITFIFWFRFGFVVWVISVIGIALLIFVIMYLLSTRRVTIEPDAVHYRNGLGVQKTIRFDQVEGVKVFINYYEQGFGIVPRVAIAQKAGTPLVLNALYWPAEDLDKLLAVFAEKKITTEYYEDVATYFMIAKQFPNYATYVERRPYLLATLIVIGIVVLVTVGVLLWTFLGE